MFVCFYRKSTLERVRIMVDRISTTGLTGVGSSGAWSALVKVRNLKPKHSVTPRHGDERSSDQHFEEGAVVMGVYCGAGQDRDGVAIYQVTSILLVDDLEAMIERAGRNLLLLATRFLGGQEKSSAMILVYIPVCWVGWSVGSMGNSEGETNMSPVRLQFDRRLKLEFHGSRITSDAGLLAYRELGNVLGLAAFAGSMLADSRTGKKLWHGLVGLLYQSVYGRLAGCEDVNDADRFGRDALDCRRQGHRAWRRIHQPDGPVRDRASVGE
jgi:hypothetical protein